MFLNVPSKDTIKQERKERASASRQQKLVLVKDQYEELLSSWNRQTREEAEDCVRRFQAWLDTPTEIFGHEDEKIIMEGLGIPF